MSTDLRIRAALIWGITFAVGLILPPVIQSLAKRPWLLLLAATGASVAAAVEAATDRKAGLS